MVLEGFCREVTVNELCRREGIKPNNFYSWTKEFKETDKQRLSRDMTRDATRQEDNALKRESEDLKDLVAELSLDLHRLKKTSIPSLCEGVANARASPRRLRSFRRLSHPRAPSARFYQGLESKNDCYRWRARARQGSLEDRRHPGPS